MMDVDKLEGRELDAAVAELVMNYTGRFKCRKLKNEGVWIVAFENAPNLFGSYNRYWKEDGTKLYLGKPHAVHFVPQFSIDIKYAWQVVEKMAEGHYPEFYAWFDRHGWNISQQKAHEIAENICHAALKVVEIDK